MVQNYKMKLFLFLFAVEISTSTAAIVHKDNETNSSMPSEHLLQHAGASSNPNLLLAEENVNYKSATVKDQMPKVEGIVLNNNTKSAASNTLLRKLAETQKKMIKKLRRKIQGVYLNIKREAQILDHMLYRFENYPDERLSILSHLEDIIHQYDTGRDFAKKGGFKVLLSVFNSTDEKVVAASLLVIGSAMQGNPDVQNVAYELHLDDALKMFFSHKSNVILSRAFYAVSSYLRQSPAAQERFIKTGGFHSLLNTLNDSNISVKLKIKVINIINDLGVEQQEAFQNAEKLKDPGVLNQYHNLPIQEEIKKCNSCSIIPHFLHEDDFDVQQKIVSAMNTLLPICGDMYANKTIQLRIAELLSKYQPSDDQNNLYVGVDIDSDSDEYLEKSLYKDLSMLLERISKSKVYSRKDEL